jgi:hypothetical protein
MGSLQVIPYLPTIVMCWTQVCSPFWQRASGLSKTRYYGLRRRVSNGGGAAPTEDSNPLKRKRKSPQNDRKNDMSRYMERQFKLFGQYIPNANEVHLPVGFSKSGMHLTYTAFVGEDDAMDQGTFGRHWATRYPRVKINKSTDFAKCNTCINAKETMDALSTSSGFRGMTQSCFDICDTYIIHGCARRTR